MTKPTTVDAYIAGYPDDVRQILQRVRETILSVVPAAGEKITYQMPTITMDGLPLLYFAGWKHHVGVYPIPRADGDLEDQIAPYRAAKDSVRLPLKSPIPYELVARICEFLVERRRAA